jgi:hypothetical protein
LILERVKWDSLTNFTLPETFFNSDESDHSVRQDLPTFLIDLS